MIVESTAAVDWDFLFSGVNYDSIWKVFSDKLYEIIDNHVPKVVYRTQARTTIRNYPKVIRDLITRKKILWRNWRIHKSNISKSKYCQAAKNVRQAIIEFVSEKESQVVKSNNLGRFFKYVNRKLSRKSGIGLLKDDGGNLISDPLNQATMFNEFFASKFVNDDGLTPDVKLRAPAGVGISNITFAPGIVLKRLNQLKSNSAGGPDNLPPEFLKKISKFIFKPLAYMFETFFINTYVPPIWRHATVRPIFKSGNPSDI